MASGGFGYAECSILYDSMGYFSKRSWALAVHIARCKAFVWATRACSLIDPDSIFNGVWQADETVNDIEKHFGKDPDIQDPDDPDYEDYILFIQDLHQSDVDPNGQYPAFYTVFYNPRTNVNYAIITSLGFTNNSSQANDPSKGLYIPNEMLSGNGTKKFIPFDLAHQYACNGLSSKQNISAGTLGAGELCVSSTFNNYTSVAGSTSTASSTSGIVQNPTQGVTYTFGYAVKELAIECFYKNSLYASNAGMLWSLIGNIFSGDLGYDDDNITFSKFPFGYVSLNRNNMKETDALQLDTYTYYMSDYGDMDVLCDDDGYSYRKKSWNLAASTPFLLPSFMPFRSSSTSPQKLKWAAGCVGFSFNAGYNTTRDFAGIDGLGNNTKGYLKDDLFRFVSTFATRIGGATYQGSRFVSMNSGWPQNNLEFGVLLGWDMSNPSII